MERRFTGFLIPILIATLVYLMFFAGDGKDKKQAPVPVQDPALQSAEVQKAIQDQASHPDVGKDAYFDHVFGVQAQGDDPGHGYEVGFSKHGAGVRWINLNDHFVSPKAAKKAYKERGDYYPVVPHLAQSGVWYGYGLVLEEYGENRFAKQIDDGEKNQLWECETPADGASEVVFTLDLDGGLRLEKVYRYVPDTRDLKVTIRLRRVGERDSGLPSSYQVRLRGVNLWNPVRARVFNNPAAAVGAVRGADDEQMPVRIPASTAIGVTMMQTAPNAKFDYAGTTNRFFGGFLFPADHETGDAVQSVTCGSWPPSEVQISGTVDEKPTLYTIEPLSVPEVYAHLKLDVPAEEGGVESLDFRLYLGPKSSSIFEGDYARFQPVMDGDLEPMCCCTVPGVQELAKVITWLLKAFQSVVGNWGVAIIMLTLVVRVLLSPLNFNMQRTMRAHGSKMAKLKPELEKIQTQFKDDPKRLQSEMMKFNKEHKLISAPLKGCLPIFVTMPIWFGLFTALRVMYELRHEGFAFWINDLSTPDRLFATGLEWTPLAYFNLLPIIMVALWLYLQMGTPLPKDPQQRQMMVMMRFMPVMMGVMLYNYAAGLMIYMCTSSVWGIVEQKVTKRILGPVDPDAVGPGTMPML